MADVGRVKYGGYLDTWSAVINDLARSYRTGGTGMHVTEDGSVVGSIDRAALAEVKASDEGVKAQLEQLQAEAEAAEAEVEPQAEVEVEAEAEPEEDLDALRAEAEAAGVKVDKRWGAERLRQEIDEAGEG